MNVLMTCDLSPAPVAACLRPDVPLLVRLLRALAVGVALCLLIIGLHEPVMGATPLRS